MAATKLLPRYPIYIPSKGRADACLTARCLDKDGVPFHLVVEPQERDAYVGRFGAERVHVLPFSNLGLGSIPARNWIWEHAKAAGGARHWNLDDNIRDFYRGHFGKRIYCAAGAALRITEDFVDRYENVAIAGLNYDMFWVTNKIKVPPFYLNVHVYSCTLILNSLLYRWRGRYNEDTDLCLQVLAGGWCTILMNAFLQKKMGTMKMRGGNEEVYKGDGRLKMARSLERLWPGVVRVGRRYQRPQHIVFDAWGRFDTPLKLKLGIDLAKLPSIDNRGFRLVALKPPKSQRMQALLKGAQSRAAGAEGMAPRMMMRSPLLGIKRRMLASGPSSAEMRAALESIGMNPKRPLGKINPWAWCVEPVRGCNLRCVFCVTRLFKPREYSCMSMDSWHSLLSLMAVVTPYGRISMANSGEPTLHPDFLELMRDARRTAPHVQLLLYTNGTTLVSGKLTYRAMFEAGLNCVFTDMYAPYAVHKKLAVESGYEWYREGQKPDSIVNVFEYRDDPNRHTIRLAENPYSWAKMKMARGGFQTYLNNLDWPAARLFGITPVESPPRRRCDQPSKHLFVNYDGKYNFCCFNAMNEAGVYGNVAEGVEGFMKHWLGQYLQDARQKLVNKDRAAHELCRKCSFVSIRGDIPYWKAGTDQFWDGSAWKALPAYQPSDAPAGELKRMNVRPR